MAKKKLNRKVALIGLVIFVLCALCAIWAVLRFMQDPVTFIKDGDEALVAKDYEKAKRSYLRARARTKSDSLRVEILFKLVDLYLETKEWNYIQGCWSEVIQLEPKNFTARFGLLKYVYIMADNGARGFWKEVQSQAAKFIELADANVLAEPVAKWELFGIQQVPGAARTDMCLYLLKSRAAIERAKMGEVTDSDELITEAIDDLQKVLTLDPNNVNAYEYLAQAFLARGNILASRGNLEEKVKAADQAKKYRQQAVNVAGHDVRTHINFLIAKRDELVNKASLRPREELLTLEADYLALVEKFGSSHRAYEVLAAFYRALGHKYYDKVLEALEKAIELDNENVNYALRLAELNYRIFSVYGENDRLHEAIDVAKNTLKLPNTQEDSGPRHWANKVNRIWLYSFLANCYIEQLLEPSEVLTEAETQQWSDWAEQTVHEIEQLLGSGEDPRVIKWQGMLDLAKGNRSAAIRKLYTIYEQYKTTDQRDAQLSYALARVFRDTVEIGAAMEFMASALTSGIGGTKPEANLDYASFLLRVNEFDRALNVLDGFEKVYWVNQRSQRLRMRAYIGTKQFDRIEEALAEKDTEDPNAITLKLVLVGGKIGELNRALRKAQESKDDSTDLRPVEVMTAELEGYQRIADELTIKLLAVEPNFVAAATVASMCRNRIASGQIDAAGSLVNAFLNQYPDNTTILFLRQLLAEPDPAATTLERRSEIEEQIFSDIADPISRAANLGAFYQRNNDPNQAIREYKKILKVEADENDALGTPLLDQNEPATGSQRFAVSNLFDLALQTKKSQLVELMTQVARHQNIDDCEGNLFAAQLAISKEQYTEALRRIDECLTQKPVFSIAYMIRSNINEALGNNDASVEDARKAMSFNPLNGTIAKVWTKALYRRNQKLGKTVTAEQVEETRRALVNAMALNPEDKRLQSFYAEYISDKDPEQALAIQQSLLKAFPNVQNALQLGQMALRIAVSKEDQEPKKLLFDIAKSAFDQARALDPQNQVVLRAYANYYRATGESKKAEDLLTEAQSPRLLLDHYYETGQLEQAKAIALQLYEVDPKDPVLVRAILLISKGLGDREAVKRVSEELLLLDDSTENHLIQVQLFLNVGLVKEAEHKLASFREKYPDELRGMLLDAMVAMRQGQLKRSLNLANHYLENDQDSALAWRLRGQVNLLMANYDEAIRDLKKSRSLSDEADTRLLLARTYLRAGREQEATTELRSAIELPQAPMEARALLGQVYWRLKRFDDLKKLYDDTLEKYPDDTKWLCQAGAFALASKDFNRAEQLYQDAFQKTKVSSYVLSTTALAGYLQSLLLAEKFDKVFEEAGKYIDGEFAPIAFLSMAEAKLKLGDKDTAIQYCRKAVDKAASDENMASRILYRVYRLVGQEEVQKYCDERLESEPESLVANYAMFSLAMINAEYNKALDYVDKCLEIVGPEDNPRRDKFIIRRTEALEAAYKKTSDNSYLKRLIKEYESFLAKAPNNLGALNNLAYVMAQNDERLDEALKYAQRAYELKPNDPGLLDTYAYVLYKNGDYSKAAEYSQASLQQYERDRVSAPAEVYEHLGMIHEKLDSLTEARAAYRRALEIGAESLSEVSRQRINDAIERISP